MNNAAKDSSALLEDAKKRPKEIQVWLDCTDSFERERCARGRVIRELKHARFWNADGNRKSTFRVPGQWCPLDFYTNHL